MNEGQAARATHQNRQAALAAADDPYQRVPWTEDMEQLVFQEGVKLHQNAHEQGLPLTPNLIAIDINC